MEAEYTVIILDCVGQLEIGQAGYFLNHPYITQSRHETFAKITLRDGRFIVHQLYKYIYILYRDRMIVYLSLIVYFSYMLLKY